MRIENEPYIPLVVERHNHELYLTHYLKQNGDVFIDSEMIFRIQSDGQLQFKETAVQNPFRGGEHRAVDRTFAQMFARNILEQGFAEAARGAQLEIQPSIQDFNEQNVDLNESQHDHTLESLHPRICSYLEIKNNYPEALVLMKAGDFYETCLEDAQIIADKLELVRTSMDSGDPAIGRVPLAGFPVHALDRYLQQLTKEFIVVTVEEHDLIAVHSQQQPQIQQVEQQAEAVTAEVEELSLFDLNSFTTATPNYDAVVNGYDPTWNASIKPPESTRSVLSTQATQSPEASDITVKPTQQSPQFIQQSNLRELADQVRETELEVVAANLGLEQDQHDHHKWKDRQRIISINGSKFMDWTADKGGGGAIDLVMHVQGVEFVEAVQWLSGQPLTPRSATHRQQPQIEKSEPRSLEMPVPNDQRWIAVHEYLVETRKLPAALIDRLHERGLIYADEMQNAVFVRYAIDTNEASIWKRVQPTGASLRGTWGENNSFHGLVPGSSREEGWFWVGAGKGAVKRVMLTESPIDALSLATLDKQRQERDGATIYLSTDGSGGMPTVLLKQVLERGGQVIAAFDVDQAGEDMAWKVAQELPSVRRVTPAYGKDWNERLIHDGHPEQALHPNQDKQTFNTLWKWHRVAQELGKSQRYVQRITEVARAVVKGEPLSDQARTAMQQDLEIFVQRQTQSQKSSTLSEAVRGKSQRGMEIEG